MKEYLEICIEKEKFYDFQIILLKNNVKIGIETAGDNITPMKESLNKLKEDCDIIICALSHDKEKEKFITKEKFIKDLGGPIIYICTERKTLRGYGKYKKESYLHEIQRCKKISELLEKLKTCIARE